MEPASIDEEIQKNYTQFPKFPNLPGFLSPDTKLSPPSITIPNFPSPATTSVSSISMAPKKASSVATRKESPVATRRSKRMLCALSSSLVATGADLEINPSPSSAVKRRVRTFWGKSPQVKRSSKLVESGSNVVVAVEKGDVGGNIESSVDKDVAAEADKDGNNNVAVDVDATLNVALNSEADVVENVVSTQGIDADVGPDEAESMSLELVEPLDYNFFSKECLEVWNVFSTKECLSERLIDEHSFSHHNMVAFLKSRGLLSTVEYVAPYIENIIRYFFANLLVGFGDQNSRRFGQVYVRGKVFRFSAVEVNNVIGTDNAMTETVVDNIDIIVHTITNGQYSVWPKQLPASKLTNLYSVLHKVLIWNWMPTTNTTVVTRQQGILLFHIGQGLPFNFGQLVFDQIAALAAKEISGKLIFPSLIFKVLRSQGLDILSDDVYTDQPKRCIITSSLVSATKFQDLPWIDPAQSIACCSQDDQLIPVPRSLLLMMSRVLSTQTILHQQALSSLNSAQSQLSELLSSQKGGENSDGAGTATQAQGEVSTMMSRVLKWILLKDVVVDAAATM